MIPAKSGRRGFFHWFVRAIRNDWRLQAFLIGVLLFFVATMIVCVNAWLLPAKVGYLDSFWISLSASFIEDFVFLVLIGGVAIVMTLARPQDEIIEQRIRYMFSGKHVTTGAYNHIKNELKSLGAFSPLCRYVITYTEYDPDLNAVKAVVQSDRMIANMFRGDEFIDEDAEYAVHTDPVQPKDGIRGELLFAAIETATDRVDVISKPVALTGDGLKRSTRISIPPDDVIRFSIKYWVWHKVGAVYAVTPKRYTEMFEIRVVNESEHILTLVSANKTEPIVLTPQSEFLYPFPTLPAGRFQPFVLDKVSPQ